MALRRALHARASSIQLSGQRAMERYAAFAAGEPVPSSLNGQVQELPVVKTQYPAAHRGGLLDRFGGERIGGHGASSTFQSLKLDSARSPLKFYGVSSWTIAMAR